MSRKERTAGQKASTMKALLTNILKRRGKYNEEYSVQIGLLSRMLAHLEFFDKEMSKSDYSPIVRTISREGNERTDTNPIEILYLQYIDRCQRALRALGMNTDSKPQKGEGKSGLQAFLDEFKDGED